MSHSDEMMTKIQSMSLIRDLNALVVGFGTDEKYLKIFKIFISESSYTIDVKAYTLKK